MRALAIVLSVVLGFSLGVGSSALYVTQHDDSGSESLCSPLRPPRPECFLQPKPY